MKRGAIALALELAIAAVGGCRNRGSTRRSIREQYGPQKLKLVVFQGQVVEWFENRYRRIGIRGITFVACTSEKPGRKNLILTKIAQKESRLSTHLDLPKQPAS